MDAYGGVVRSDEGIDGWDCWVFIVVEAVKGFATACVVLCWGGNDTNVQNGRKIAGQIATHPRVRIFF